jgi:hypothetical protein
MCWTSRGRSAIDVAQTAQAENSLEKMLCHQMAGCHRVAMKQLSMALNETLPIVEIARMSSAAARMIQGLPGGPIDASPDTFRWPANRHCSARSGSDGGQAVVAGNVNGAKSKEPEGGV